MKSRPTPPTRRGCCCRRDSRPMPRPNRSPRSARRRRARRSDSAIAPISSVATAPVGPVTRALRLRPAVRAGAGSADQDSAAVPDSPAAPAAAERAGDLSALGRAIIDPSTGQPFAGNQIPASRIDSAALSLLNLFPLPNQPGTKQNFHYQTTAGVNTDDINVRLVHNFG